MRFIIVGDADEGEAGVWKGFSTILDLRFDLGVAKRGKLETDPILWEDMESVSDDSAGAGPVIYDTFPGNGLGGILIAVKELSVPSERFSVWILNEDPLDGDEGREGLRADRIDFHNPLKTLLDGFLVGTLIDELTSERSLLSGDSLDLPR